MKAGKALVEQGVNFKSIVNGGLEATSYFAVLLKLEKERAAEFIAKARKCMACRTRTFRPAPTSCSAPAQLRPEARSDL
jgi:hypothetical protein